MSDLNGFEKFDALMTEFAPKLIEPHIAKMQEEGKSYIEQRTAGFIIFNGYTEIKKSYDSLHLINKFISITIMPLKIKTTI